MAAMSGAWLRRKVRTCHWKLSRLPIAQWTIVESAWCSLREKTLDVAGPPHMRLCLLINSARHYVNDRQ
jgi:hypothetical protein